MHRKGGRRMRRKRQALCSWRYLGSRSCPGVPADGSSAPHHIGKRYRDAFWRGKKSKRRLEGMAFRDLHIEQLKGWLTIMSNATEEILVPTPMREARTNTKPGFALPPGACDVHFHVF